MASQLKIENQKSQKGFLQGNFDQALFFQDSADFEKSVKAYLQPYLQLSPEQRAGWVCALGHGVLPKTPEAHVKKWIEIVRKEFT